MDKYLSIISNFGCHYSCPYCIVKNNNLHIPKSTIYGLNKLQTEIEDNHCKWVSYVVVDDPLWEYSRHMDWYNRFFDIIKKTGNIKTELHTSMINVSEAPYALFDRVVYHLHDFEQLKNIKKAWNETVRVVFVVSENFTENLINKIAKFCDKSNQIDELSFRQMVDNHYHETNYCQDYLRAGHKRLWWYIEQNDYNLYYCENKVYTEYRLIGEKNEM